jgi:hypothetical protein
MALRPIFTHDGTRYHVGQLKVKEVEALEVELGCRYVEITPLGNMRHKAAMMRVFLARDLDEAAVTAALDDMDLDATDKAWTVEDDDLPTMYQDGLPLPGGEPSTVTS